MITLIKTIIIVAMASSLIACSPFKMIPHDGPTDLPSPSKKLIPPIASGKTLSTSEFSTLALDLPGEIVIKGAAYLWRDDITPDESEQLTKEFTEVEIKKATLALQGFSGPQFYAQTKPWEVRLVDKFLNPMSQISLSFAITKVPARNPDGSIMLDPSNNPIFSPPMIIVWDNLNLIKGADGAPVVDQAGDLVPYAAVPVNFQGGEIIIPESLQGFTFLKKIEYTISDFTEVEKYGTTTYEVEGEVTINGETKLPIKLSSF